MSNSIGLYIHIPFCKQKCPYCDFYSLCKNENNFIKYVAEMKKMIAYWSRKVDKSVSTIYFGGGTPSILGTDLLCEILISVKENFNVLNNAEITTELNPTSGKLLNFAKLKENGFNRISIGIQSSNNEELKILGRTHTQNDIIKTITSAKDAGIRNISFDLMIGIPKQTKNSLAESIKFCKDCDVNHISSYILKIEKGTDFYKNQSTLNIPDEDTQADLYLFACAELKKSGYSQYEISNFSKIGYESKHNLIYWKDCEYLGLGPSAHSFFNGKRFYYGRSINDFYNNIILAEGKGGSVDEFIMLNLRLSDGLIFDEYRNRFGKPFPTEIINKAKKFEKLHLLSIDDKKISLNSNGFLISNYIISELI